MRAWIMKTHYQTTNNTIVKALKSTVLDRLFSRHKVVMVFLGGSQLVGLDNADSDYDLNFLVVDDCTYRNYANNQGWLVVDGKMVHAYVCPLQSINQSYTGYATSLMKQYSLSPQHIVWYDEHFLPLITTYLSLTSDLCKIGILRYREILRDGGYCGKNSYAYIWAADKLLGTNFGIDCVRNWKQYYPNATENERRQMEQTIQTINVLVDQTGENWQELWSKVYTKLKMML